MTTLPAGFRRATGVRGLSVETGSDRGGKKRHLVHWLALDPRSPDGLQRAAVGADTHYDGKPHA
jgi:hypothetical protein